MSSLDLQYVTELVRHAKAGDANAFAELFAATYQQQYQFCCSYLKDTYLAQEALQETYIKALNTISRLNDHALVVAWLTQLNFRTCLEMKRKYDPALPENVESMQVLVNGREYTLYQLMNLPFTQSQVMLLKWFCGMKPGQIARLLEISRRQTLEYLSSGSRRLMGRDEKGAG